MRHITNVWIHRVLNLLLYLSLCVMTGTGFLIAYRLPPGSHGGRGLTVLGWRRHEWGEIHFYVSWIFVALIAGHVALHWNWLKKVACRESSPRLALGLAAGAAIVVFFLVVS